MAKVTNQINKLKEVLNGHETPDIKIGLQCDNPYECDFKGHCWKDVPEYSVFNISRLKAEKKFELYKRAYVVLIDVPETESLHAIQMGIPPENIFIDTLAQHSTENVYYSYYIAQDNGLENIAVASDPYQTKALKPFVRKLNRKLNTNVLLLPAILDSLTATPMKGYKIDYQQAIGSNFINFTETQSLIYRLFGTMGAHINWKARPQMEPGNSN
jgi:hypothetical protein